MSARKRALSTASLFESAGVHQFKDTVARDGKSVIVALARKMLRWFEYLGMNNVACPVVTERALPWLSPKETAVGPMVFSDDLMNVGTTISHYVSYAHRRLGADIKVRIYANRLAEKLLQAKSPVNRYDLQIQESFDEQEYWQFETALPQELWRLGKPYDVDFPIIETPLTQEEIERSGEQWCDLLQGDSHLVYDLTLPQQRARGILSFSLIERARRLASVGTGHEDFSPMSKVRVYVSQPEGLIRLVPIAIPAVRAEALMQANVGLPDALEKLYQEFAAKAAQAEPFEFEPQYNLLVYLVSFSFGLRCLSRLRTSGAISHYPPALAPRDLQFIFGPTVGERLRRDLTEILSSTAKNLAADEISPLGVLAVVPVKQKLADAIVAKLIERNYRNDIPVVIVRETLRILDEMVRGNDPECTSEYPDYKRLRIGLRLCDFCHIVKKISPSHGTSIEEMSALFDCLIDLGAMVPVVEAVDGLYLRTYRRGEADPIEFAQFVRELLQEHQQVFPDRPLMKWTFSKIVSAIAIYHGDRVPLDLGFEYLGTVARIKDSDVEDRLESTLNFLVRHGFVTLKKRGKSDTSGQLELWDLANAGSGEQS